MVRHNLTGSHYGLTSWLQQRVTAIIMLVAALAFFIFILTMAIKVNASITSWQGLFQYTLTKIGVQLFFAALLLHAWVGMRDLWMDYVTSNRLRAALHVLTILWLLGSLIYSIKIIWA
jgi:succinate dehydrogenase / fumarate reductase membrane anchor subunit